MCAWKEECSASFSNEMQSVTFSSVLGEFRAKKERKKFFKKKKISLLLCTTNARITPSVVVFYTVSSQFVYYQTSSVSSFSCVPFASYVGLFSDDATTMSENRDGAHDDGKSKKRRIVRNNQKQNEKTHRHHHPHHNNNNRA